MTTTLQQRTRPNLVEVLSPRKSMGFFEPSAAHMGLEVDIMFCAGRTFAVVAGYPGEEDHYTLHICEHHLGTWFMRPGGCDTKEEAAELIYKICNDWAELDDGWLE